MPIKETISDQVAIFKLEGNFLCEDDGGKFKSRLIDLLATGIKCVIIDLGAVTCINSEGLGMLIGALTTLKQANVDLRLANTTDLVDNLLIITQLVRIFDKHQTVDQALSSFKDKEK
ncbi:MAG: STAS domain-containing protein [Ignavibacteriae bacterium]|nr:STAS domain-containing protein [Ignavibacteria bacterium]MBI3363515.1 STAS domain-containing protein [Ignavibacteriota bacterium]